jgi:pimeloyl-ACP methyl ester carboxylesterase
MSTGLRPHAARRPAFETAELEAAYFAAYHTVLAQWPVPYEAVDVSSEFGTTRVHVCGPADAEPLVLLHGLNATSGMWYANVEALSREYRVYAVDTMGEPGRSVHDGRPITGMADFMAWLDTLLDALGLDAVRLGGHSFGGHLALHYALHAPERVARLVLLDPVLGFILGSLRLANPSEERVRAFFGSWANGSPTDQAFKAFMELLIQGIAHFPSSKPVIPRRPGDERLRALARPTLLLAENSEVHNARRGVDKARRLVPGIVAEIVPGASHNLPMEDPATVDRRVLEFLAS